MISVQVDEKVRKIYLEKSKKSKDYRCGVGILGHERIEKKNMYELEHNSKRIFL